MGGKILRGADENLIRKLKKAGRLSIFLDYDGTIVPLRQRPEIIPIDQKSKCLLKRLAAIPGAKVFIVSGRSLRDIKRFIGIRGLYYIGNHGIELEGPGLKYVNPRAKSARTLIRETRRELEKKITAKGVIIEDKIYTLSLHYRFVRPESVGVFKKIFRKIVRRYCKDKKLLITKGKKILEIRPYINWNKGKMVNWVIKKMKLNNTSLVAMGDDLTDEDAFRALGRRGISILVSKRKRKTFAQYRLSSTKEVARFLESIA